MHKKHCERKPNRHYRMWQIIFPSMSQAVFPYYPSFPWGWFILLLFTNRILFWDIRSSASNQASVLISVFGALAMCSNMIESLLTSVCLMLASIRLLTQCFAQECCVSFFPFLSASLLPKSPTLEHIVLKSTPLPDKPQHCVSVLVLTCNDAACLAFWSALVGVALLCVSLCPKWRRQIYWAFGGGQKCISLTSCSTFLSCLYHAREISHWAWLLPWMIIIMCQVSSSLRAWCLPISLFTQELNTDEFML